MTKKIPYTRRFRDGEHNYHLNKIKAMATDKKVAITVIMVTVFWLVFFAAIIIF